MYKIYNIVVNTYNNKKVIYFPVIIKMSSIRYVKKIDQRLISCIIILQINNLYNGKYISFLKY